MTVTCCALAIVAGYSVFLGLLCKFSLTIYFLKNSLFLTCDCKCFSSSKKEGRIRCWMPTVGACVSFLNSFSNTPLHDASFSYSRLACRQKKTLLSSDPQFQGRGDDSQLPIINQSSLGINALLPIFAGIAKTCSDNRVGHWQIRACTASVCVLRDVQIQTTTTKDGSSQ